MKVGYAVSYIFTQFQVSAVQKEGEPSFFANQNVTFQQTRGKGREMWDDEYRISGLRSSKKGGIGASRWGFSSLRRCVYDLHRPFGVAENRDCIEWRHCSLQMKALLLYSLFQIVRRGIWN